MSWRDAGAPPALPDARALLHQAERGPALAIERGDFAVKNGGLALMNSGKLCSSGNCSGEVILIARHQSNFALGDKRNGAVAVPLDLEQPFGIVERVVDGSCQHGVDRGGHGTFDRAL